MKLIVFGLFFILTSFHSVQTNAYICGAKGAKKYHLKESCRGLSACKHEVVKTTVKEAQSYGLTICGWED